MEDDGRAVLRVIRRFEAIGARAVDSAIGSVRQIRRRGVRYRVDGMPWSLLARVGSTRGWVVAERVAAATRRVRHLADQLRPSPEARTVEAGEARSYATAGMLAAYVELAREGLFESEEEIVARYFRPGTHVLDVGCGTGREAFGFAQRGLRVTGVDVCERAIDEAKKAAATLEHGSVKFATMALSELSFPEASFDAIFLSSDIYAGIPTRERRVATLARCRRLLNPGGVVVLPAMVGHTRLGRLLIDEPRRLARKWTALKGRVPEPGDRWFRIDPDGVVPRSFRHTFASENDVRSEIAAAHLEVVERISVYWVTRPTLFRYRQDARVIERNLDGKLLLVSLETGDTFAMNATAKAIWELAREGVCISEIADRLPEVNGASRAQIEQDAHDLLESMVDRALCVRETVRGLA